MVDLSLRHEPEQNQRELLEIIFRDTALSQFDMFRNFPVFTPRFNLARFLAHYELFKKVTELPGVIIDLGVFQGGSTFAWAKFCEIFCPTDVKKKVFAFDTFEGFAGLSSEDGPENHQVGLEPGGYKACTGIRKDLETAQAAMNQDKHISHIDRIEFIEGDVCLTVPEFVQARGKGLKVALLNLDLDLFAPTKTALEHLVPCMVKGGIIILDQYADNHFSGETTAVDEYFLKTTGAVPRVKKFTWHSNPAAFIEVE